MKIQGHIVDLEAGAVFPGEVTVADGRIARIERRATAPDGFVIPGFVDAHVHVESSMLAPAEFSRAASVHGTVATVSDPHEIANVLGVPGVEYMIHQSARGMVRTFYGAPSCVPATAFETAGARLDARAVAALITRDDIHYLSEVMNFPGVLAGDAEVLAKIAAAVRAGKPVDGHAPGMNPADSVRYAAAGITTDHECATLEEAHGKLAAGMKILIREGSAARNFDALAPLLFSHPERCMFCSDDIHPDALLHGHINLLVRRAVAAGVDPIVALRVACRNPVLHYRLPIGLLREGDSADFLLVENLADFSVRQTWIGGVLAAENGRSTQPFQRPPVVNHFAAHPVPPSALRLSAPRSEADVEVMIVEDGQLVTGRETHRVTARNGCLESDPARDLLKIAVVNRYAPAPPAVAFVRGFGLARGAIASSVAHDSHNIVAVGADDDSLARAIHLVMARQGGVCAVDGSTERLLPLPIAGLMADGEAAEVAQAYAAVEGLARALGSPLRAPLMTLSFMALLVIPALKLSDRGLFDGRAFQFVPPAR